MWLSPLCPPLGSDDDICDDAYLSGTTTFEFFTTTVYTYSYTSRNLSEHKKGKQNK